MMVLTLRRIRLLGSFVVIVLGFLPFSALGGQQVVVNSLGMTFVHIPAGSFTMGSPPDEPGRNSNETRHRVEITVGFYLQTTEVTQEQWWTVMGKKLIGKRKGDSDLPVTRVSWYDVQDYIQRLNRLGEGVYWLPSEAQWEYACRAGSTTAYFWGNTIGCDRAMYANSTLDMGECILAMKSRGLASDMPAPVKSFPPNAWGLYDMHGNVWEWCRDCYVTTLPSGERVNPLVFIDGTPKVRRGGSWFKGPEVLRSANRAYAHASTRLKTTGFRLVLDPGPR